MTSILFKGWVHGLSVPSQIEATYAGAIFAPLAPLTDERVNTYIKDAADTVSSRLGWEVEVVYMLNVAYPSQIARLVQRNFPEVKFLDVNETLDGLRLDPLPFAWETEEIGG